MTTDDPVAIGRYKVVRRLGAGAMGAVYLCQDPLLKRPVAVKIVLKSRADGETMMARFQRESEISAQLNHPHIITVYDVGLDEEVGPFLTMEYVDGGSLASHIEAGPLPKETTLDWLTQLGEALAAAERAGVVHRDIKPENMLISSRGQLKLTDFGLARDDLSSLTTTGTMMGTPTHTAPELLGGARATPVTDRWAFCVTAFQMVLGQLPHSGDTLASVLRHIDQEPPLLPEGTPAPLARVFIKALHKDPARRYDSILAFMTALADVLDLRDQLVVRGLGVDAPAAATSSRTSTPSMKASGETEAFTLPKGAGSSSAGRSSGVGVAPAETPAAPQARRLTKPPAELFAKVPSAAASSDPPPDPYTLPSSPAPRPSAGRVSSPRIAPRRESILDSDLLGKIGLGVVVVGGALGFYFFPRQIVVQTTPPGAQVVVNGKPVGTTPYEGSVSFGTHQLVVSKDGFDTIDRQFQAGQGPIAITLQPYTAWVDLVTVPAGASAVLGGQPLGATPRTGIQVPERPTPLVISLAGYKPWRGTLGPGQKPPERIVLVKEGR